MSTDQTVFIVDDDEAMRSSLRWLVESVGLTVATFSSAREFLDQYQPNQPGCLLLDVRMPGMSGIELLEKLTAQPDCLPIIILTGHGDVPMAVRAIKTGALDFLQKPFNDQELLDRIQLALDQDSRRRHESSALGSLKSQFETLTPREREIMQLVVTGRSNKTIASELGISCRTVEVHRARLMKKLHTKTLADLVQASVALEGSGRPPKGN